LTRIGLSFTVRHMPMSETLGEIVALTPKPRGDGTWAWVRYHLLRVWHWNKPFRCAETGCPYPAHWVVLRRPRCRVLAMFCELHDTPEHQAMLAG
jgi:hypothetical protein